MKVERGKTGPRQIRLWPVWFLVSLALLLALWKTPLIQSVHRQVGTRAFLKAAFQSEPSPADPPWSLSVEARGLASAMSHLKRANIESDAQSVTLNTYRTLGVAELATGNPANARKWLLRRLETAPGDVLARFFLGEAFLRLGDVQAAIQEWKAAGAQQQLMWLAEDLAEREAWTEALTALDAVMELDATDVRSRWLAARIWREQGNAQRTLVLCQELLEIDAQSEGARQLAAEIYIEQGDTQRGLALSQELIAIVPQKPIGYMLSGIALFDEGQYEQSIIFFEEALRRDPLSPHWIWVRLGKAHAALEQWPEAIEAFGRAIHEDPTHDWDYVLMADAQCQAGHPQGAHSYYEQAIALGVQSDRVRQAAEYIARHQDCPP